jgi:hypothetical protein
MTTWKEDCRLTYILLDSDLSGEVSQDELKAFRSVVNCYRGHECKVDAENDVELQDEIKAFTDGYADAFRPKYSMVKGFFLLMLLVGAASLGIYVAQTWIAISLYAVVVSYDFLVAVLCILQIKHSSLLQRFVPHWIYDVSLKGESSTFSFIPKSETRRFFETWDYMPPFMVFFDSVFRPNTSILCCRVPSSVHPLVVVSLRLGNTCIITAGLLWRLAATSYNEKFGFTGFIYQQFPCNIPQDSSYMMPPSLIGTAHYISIVLSGCLWVATLFKLQDRSLGGLEKAIFDLKRYKLSFNLYRLNPQTVVSTSAYDLWTQFNLIWRESCCEHFFGKLSGFADIVEKSSSGSILSNQVAPANNCLHSQQKPLVTVVKREKVFLRICFLSVFPVILAFFQTVLLQASRIPSVSKVMRLASCKSSPECYEYMAMNGISRACETAIVHDILVSSEFAPLNSVLINVLVITGTFIMACGIVHTITFMTTITFFLNYMRLKCLSKSIHPMFCLMSKVFCPFVSLSSGKQIRSWVQLYHLEKMAGNMHFGVASAGLSSFFAALIILGACEVAVTVLKSTIPAILAFACYWILVAVFFLVSLVFAASTELAQRDICLRVRDQQFIFNNREKEDEDENDPVNPSPHPPHPPHLATSNDQVTGKVESLVTHLEQTDAPLKLLRFIPANFFVLQLLLGYMFSVIVAVCSLLYDRGSF